MAIKPEDNDMILKIIDNQDFKNIEYKYYEGKSTRFAINYKDRTLFEINSPKGKTIKIYAKAMTVIKTKMFNLPHIAFEYHEAIRYDNPFVYTIFKR